MAAGPSYGIDGPDSLVPLVVCGVLTGLLVVGAGTIFSPERAVQVRHATIGLSLSLLSTAGIRIWFSKRSKFKIIERLLAELSWRDGMKVLDVGCGTGALLNAVAKRLSVGLAIGLDVWSRRNQTRNRPQVARSNSLAEGVGERTTLVMGDARKLPFPNDCFDIVCSSFALSDVGNARRRQQAVEEIIRVLKKNGQLMIVDILVKDYLKLLRDSGFKDIRFSRASLFTVIPSYTISGTKGTD